MDLASSKPAPAADERKEHSWLFKGQMIRAILSGQKRQTRRVVTWHNSLIDGQPTGKKAWEMLDWSRPVQIDPGPSPAGNPGPYWKVHNVDGQRRHRVCPRIMPGDLVWVRETFRLWLRCDDPDIYLGKVGDYPEHWRMADSVDYKATSVNQEPPWRPSIFMPRWASRITLEVKAAVPQFLWDIGTYDMIAEGIVGLGGGEMAITAEWIDLWDSINNERGYGWDENPPVWAYTFERVSH